MAMAETENMTPWLFLTNTVFVSIAMVLWYFAIWLEDIKEIDETNIVIIDADECQVNKEEDDTNGKRIIDGEDFKKQGMSSDKKSETKDSRKYEDDSCFRQTISEKDIIDIQIQDNFMQTAEDTEQTAKYTEQTAVNTKQTVIDTEQTAIVSEQTGIETEQAAIDTEQNTTTNSTHQENAAPSENMQIIKSVDNLSPGATFQWPRHENTVEQLRAGQDQNRVGVSQELLDKLQSLGIMRDSSDQSAVRTDSAVPLSDCARLSGQLLGRKIRISWDTFLAKSRPGLETGSPRQRKSLNRRKQKSVKGWKAASSSFVEIVKQDKCAESMCAALSL